MKTIVPLFVIALLLAYGCDDGSNSAADVPVDLNGRFLGIALVTGGTAYPPNASYPVLFTLSQSGSAITGEYGTGSTGSDTSGTVVGTVSGRTLAFTLTEDAPCGGTFTGSATVGRSSVSFSGAYSGDDCSGTTEASFSASK